MNAPEPAPAEALTAAIARAQRAAADPACAAWLGPVAPGATMPGGARVPGLCHELDPVQAAFNLGVMLAWETTAEPRSVERVGTEIRLAALLAAGDWWARRQRLLAARVPTVGDLQRALHADRSSTSPAGAVLQLLGQTATTDASNLDHESVIAAPSVLPDGALRAGGAAAQAVRIALLCLRRSGALLPSPAAPTIQSLARDGIVDDLPLDAFITGLCGT